MSALDFNRFIGRDFLATNVGRSAGRMVDRLRLAAKIQPIIEVKRIGVVPIVTSCTDFEMNPDGWTSGDRGDAREFDPEARIILATDYDDDEDGYSEKTAS